MLEIYTVLALAAPSLDSHGDQGLFDHQKEALLPLRGPFIASNGSIESGHAHGNCWEQLAKGARTHGSTSSILDQKQTH